MHVIEIQDKNLLYNYFKKDICLYAYHIGDLDNFFFVNCSWYVLFHENEIQEVALLYKGSKKPTVLLFGRTEGQKVLMENVLDILPKEFFCHYSISIKNILSTKYLIEPLGMHFKMMLKDIHNLEKAEDRDILFLSNIDIPDIQKLFTESYPENYFTNRMLETGKYVGIKDKDTLIGIAGVHVYSKIYKIAILGNITVHPDYRNHGIGKRLITSLLLNLKNDVDFIGLNVKANNTSAIHLYNKLGFIKCAEYEEGILRKI